MSYTAAQFEARMREVVEAGRAAKGPSLAEQFARLPETERAAFLDPLSPVDCWRLIYEWEFWARPKQMAPIGVWTVWLMLGGRGMGKNRSGAEWVRSRIENGRKSIALIGPDWKDVRRYMVGGTKGAGGSGLLDVWPQYPEGDPRNPRLIENKAEIHFPAYGAIAYLNTAEQKELRGANLDTIWGDEIIKWKYPEELWHNAELTLRDPGAIPPQAMITTTPMPMKLLKDLMMDPGTHVTHGTTFENAGNLDPRWIQRMKNRLQGTRLGAQELEALVLGDNPDALFKMRDIDEARVGDSPVLVERAVGVDPAVSTKRKSDATGIVAAGRGLDDHLYVIGDVSGKMSPDAWPRAAVDLAVQVDADFIVVERNKIGDLAKNMIQRELQKRKLLGRIEVREVTAMNDKGARAMPVAALCERHMMHLVGRFHMLETELTEWNPKTTSVSPNRLDALVHTAVELLGLDEELGAMTAEEAWAGIEEANRGFEVESGYL